MTDTDSLPHSPLYNVQPTSHSSKQRVFPSLPYSPENLKFIRKFNFQFSDLTDTEYITLCNLLLNIKPVMLLIKTMLVKLLLLSAFVLNPMLNYLHNVHLKYQFITVINLTLFSKI